MDRIVAEYPMRMTGQEFYQKNYYLIQGMVQSRTIGAHVAAL